MDTQGIHRARRSSGRDPVLERISLRLAIEAVGNRVDTFSGNNPDRSNRFTSLNDRNSESEGAYANPNQAAFLIN